MSSIDLERFVYQYEVLINALDVSSSDQPKRLVSSAVELLKDSLEVMTAGVWVCRPGMNFRILEIYVDRGDTQGDPEHPHSICLTEDAIGLFPWVAEKNQSLWIEEVPERPLELTNCLTREVLQGRYIHIYPKTREFAAVPIRHDGIFQGLFVVESGQSRHLKRADIEIMERLARHTGHLLWKANGYEVRKSRADNAIHRFARDVIPSGRGWADFRRLYEEHHESLQRFRRRAAYDRSVFVMTKYPVNEAARNDNERKLERVIEIVQEELKRHGFEPRLARDERYSDVLWKNVEVFLLGCSSGIAIVENRLSADLNPNVAMEWGWMRAAGKDVLFLLESKFSMTRADFTGLTSERFEWDFPDASIPKAVERWVESRR